MSGRRPRSAIVAVALWTTLALVVATPAAAAERRPPPVEQRPNVVVVVTDDQSLAQFTPAYMPRTFRHLVDRSTDFSQAVVATPLCCPSRAALSTGQYGHNNGVLRNQYPLLDRKRNVLPSWLRRSGYRTIHVGRFYNGYGFVGRNSEVAPGWDIWRTALEPHGYYDYRMRFNGRFRKYGSADRDYLTTNINRIAAKLIRRKAGRDRPFYLQVDHFAPHDGPGSRTARCESAAVPAPADEAAYADEPLPMGPAFNEADITDKPDFFQQSELLDGDRLAALTRSWGCALAALREVDRGINSIWRELRRAGALRDTALIFTSDNAYLFGEHRINQDKHYPYEEALRVPMIVRLPRDVAGAGQPPESAATVANIDIAPTVLELAGAEPCIAGGCRVLDGRSLVSEAAGAPEIPADRGIAIEYDGDQPLKGLVCEYQGIRTANAIYVQHRRARARFRDPCARLTGDDELYDLAADPFQLENLFPATPGGSEARTEADLRDRSARLADCNGIAGRDPLPPSGHFCE